MLLKRNIMQQNCLTSYGIKRRKKYDMKLEWSILDKAKPYSPGLRDCMLCLNEK